MSYVKTTDFDQFLAVQQELLLRMLQAVEQAGTRLAVPLQESFESGGAPRPPDARPPLG
jgi:hypothetical protein